jgi:hypothetical protein
MDDAESMVQLSSVIVAAECLQRVLVSICHCSWWVDALQVQHMCNTLSSNKLMQTHGEHPADGMPIAACSLTHRQSAHVQNTLRVQARWCQRERLLPDMLLP